MKIQPCAHNAIEIELRNGDRFNIYSPNERELVVSRSADDGRKIVVASANVEKLGEYESLFKGWMIRLSKEAQ